MDDITPLNLANIYARFFVEDFAVNVMRHLDGSYPIDDDVLQTELENAMRQELSATPLTVSSTNAIGRFLFECAVHAIEEDIPAKTERAGWDVVKDLPSQHHQEILSVIYQSAAQYLQIVNKTLLGTIGRDAAMTHDKIRSLTDARLRSSDTGGMIKEFHWGILSNGQWLNAALMRAYDLAAVFRPGDPVTFSNTENALKFAYQHATVPELEAKYDVYGRAEVGTLIAHAAEEGEIVTEELAGQLGDSLFSPGYLRQSIDVVQRGISDVKELVWATERFSALATGLATLTATARQIDDDTIIGPLTMSALNRTNDAVVLSLAAIEALRETKYAESLIMSVATESNDPAVTVMVNADNLRDFSQAGGSDQDLVLFGHYLDPRKGVTLPAVGWSTTSVLAQRDVIVPQMMAEESDRTEQLRNNDAAYVDGIATESLKAVVDSYLKATNRTMRPNLAQQIDRFGREISNPSVDQTMGTESLSPDAKIAKILVAAIGDPFLEQVRANFTSYAHGDSAQIAPQLTVLRTAVQDAVHFISMTEEPALAE